MIALQQSLNAWGQSEFKDVLKQELMECGKELPLQAGLAAGSYAAESPQDVMVISAHETEAAIEVKVGIFYESLTPGCACAGDPTVESEQNEYLTLLVSIDKHTAEVTFQLL
jgi:hypothetical protein